MHAIIFNLKGKDLQSELCVYCLRMLNCFDVFLRVNIVVANFVTWYSLNKYCKKQEVLMVI